MTHPYKSHPFGSAAPAPRDAVPNLPTATRVGVIATVLLAVSQAFAWLVWRDHLFKKAERNSNYYNGHRVYAGPASGDPTIWMVGFVVVLIVGLLTFLSIKRAREARRRRYGAHAPERWATVAAWSVIAVVFLDFLLTVVTLMISKTAY